tara:strand:+ start:228 stop:404 length:177 start_codon:yes stop_codon:yes gene_type:complete
MLNKQIFNYAEERIEAMACHNIALWHKLVVAEQAEAARQEYYFQKMLDDDMARCLGGF